MAKQYLLSILVVCAVNFVNGQDTTKPVCVCMSTEYVLKVRKQFPELENLANLAKKSKSITNDLLWEIGGDTAVITIPVVFNIVLKDTTLVSRAQVNSQLAVLNEDFSASNNDLMLTPDYFRGLIGPDSRIRFELDTVIYTKTKEKNFLIDLKRNIALRDAASDPVKFESRGGISPRYPAFRLNIWVADIKVKDEYGLRDLNGYCLRPPAPLNLDGAVIHYKVFGRKADSEGPRNLGRTCTHEVGHYLGLKHIWGDHPCGDDDIEDTPPQEKGTYGCRTGVLPACGEKVNGAMYMNFMDYCNDGCVHMFTQKQVERMRHILAYFRPGFIAVPDMKFMEEAAFYMNVALVKDIKQQPNKAIISLNLNSSSDTTELFIRKVSAGTWNQQPYLVTDSVFSAQGLQPGELYEIKLRSHEQTDIVEYKLPSAFFIAGKGRKLKKEQLQITRDQ